MKVKVQGRPIYVSDGVISPDDVQKGSPVVTVFLPAASVTVDSGGNTWAGGDNTISFGWTGFLPGSAVTIDGKVLVDKGVLKI